MVIKRRLKLWTGVWAVIAAMAVVCFASVAKTRDTEFNERFVRSFVSLLSAEMREIDDVIARQLDRSGTDITARDDTSVSQVSDDPPVHKPMTQGMTQKIGLKRLLYLGTVSLKMLVRVCLKRSRYAM